MHSSDRLDSILRGRLVMKLSKISTNVRVFSNLAMSVDGKISTQGRELFYLGSKKDQEFLHKLRNKAEAIVFGAGVLRAFQKACLTENPKHMLVNSVFSRRLSAINPDWEFFKNPKIKRILYHTEKISDARRARFAKTSELVLVPKRNPALAILADLAKRGFQRVGVEGGGALMWEFVSKDLIDEYYVTLAPKILGGKNSPTLVDGEGFSPDAVLGLELRSMRRVGDEVFFLYVPKRPSARRRAAGTRGKGRRSREYKKTKA